MEITSEMNLSDLYSRISTLGWEVQKVKFDKKSQTFQASAKSPEGQVIEKFGPNEQIAVSNLLLAVTRKSYRATAARRKFSDWRSPKLT